MKLTEQERQFLFSIINDQYQNWNIRSLDGPLLKGMLDKLISATVTFTETENRRAQYIMQDASEVYSRIADKRLQFILQADRGVTRERNNYFNGPATFNTCQSILAKLKEDMGS